MRNQITAIRMLPLDALSKALALSVVLAAAPAFSQERPQPAYQDTQLSFEQRARDLVSRMTLEEKISQLGHTSDGIKRLGIPEYNWWNEGLHGVARAGIATVFPQAIGLAATFDEDLMHRLRKRSARSFAQSTTPVAERMAQATGTRDSLHGPPISTSSATHDGDAGKKPMARTLF